MNVRKNGGISLVSLIVTIIMLLIISGISISGAIRGNKETEDAKLLSELTMVKHAVLERYTKSQYTKETLPGEDVEKSYVQSKVTEMNNASGETNSLKGDNYKKLNPDALKSLGIQETEDTYIVEYTTGEVINETKLITKNSKKALYSY